MSEIPPTIEPAEVIAITAKPKRFPWVTYLCILITGAIFLGIQAIKTPETWETLNQFGAYHHLDIWSGKIWSLLCSAFVHVQLWHFVFNVYWFWFFAKEIEKVDGPVVTLILISTSAIFSSQCEVVFGGASGIGLSGVVYALFGYVWLGEKTSSHFTGYITTKTLNLFMFWLVICFALTYLEVMNVGNAAHVGGLVWGIFIAAMRWNTIKFKLGAQGSIILVALAFTLWQPWSNDWLRARAVKYHLENRLDEAEEYYLRILSDLPYDEISNKNMIIIRMNRLVDSAEAARKVGDVQSAREHYNAILAIDPNHAWAKQNLQTLPRR